MSTYAGVGPAAAVRITDSGDLAASEATGRPDSDALDHLKVTLNGSARQVELEADNDDGDVDEVALVLKAKGAGVVLPFVATASLPTAASWEGMLVYDSTAQKLKFSNGTAWETVTSS